MNSAQCFDRVAAADGGERGRGGGREARLVERAYELGAGCAGALAHALGDGVEARLDVQPRLLEIADGLTNQRLVLEHHLVGVENERFLLAEVLLDLQGATALDFLIYIE